LSSLSVRSLRASRNRDFRATIAPHFGRILEGQASCLKELCQWLALVNIPEMECLWIAQTVRFITLSLILAIITVAAPTTGQDQSLMLLSFTGLVVYVGTLLKSTTNLKGGIR